MTNIHLSRKSKNTKTGPIPVSTTSATTCPDSCPLKASGCYAASSFLGMHWRQVTAGKRGTSWQTFCDAIANLPIGQLWRHNQAGDLPGDNETIDRHALGKLVKANRGRKGFTYTHKPMTETNQEPVRSANELGFTINLSANNPTHADTLADLDIGPVVTLLPEHGPRRSYTPAGRPIETCPATYRDDISCATCKLCQKQNRKCIVGFPVHGAQKTAAAAAMI